MNNEFNYITNTFTKDGDNVNLEVDNLNVGCITSKNNSFNLDKDGNLTVKTINVTQNLSILNAIYPIGSIYMSVNSANPSTLIGGTWVAWGGGRVPVGVDTSQTEFNTVEKTSGAKEQALTAAQLPKHTHTIASAGAHNHNGHYLENRYPASGNSFNHARPWSSTYDSTGNMFSGSEGAHTHTASEIGSGTAHNNLQPYITCYMWKRTA